MFKKYQFEVFTRFAASLVVFSIASLSVVGCQKEPVDKSTHVELSNARIRGIAKSYFATYAKRDDWKGFLDFYASDVRFNDQQLGVELEGRKAFENFYNWPDDRFQKVDESQPILEINELVVEDQAAIARGKFNPFIWDGQINDWPGEFVIWLKFNDEGKIVEQRDFIPYPKSLLPEPTE